MVPSYIESSDLYKKYISSNMIEVDAKHLQFVEEIKGINDFIKVIEQLKVWKVNYNLYPSKQIFDFILNNLHHDSSFYLQDFTKINFVEEILWFVNWGQEGVWEFSLETAINKNFQH